MDQISMNFFTAFQTQLQNLLDKGYAEASKLPKADFVTQLKNLESKLPTPDRKFEVDIEQGKLSFVIVVKSNVVPTEDAMSRTVRNGVQGITKLFPHTSSDFQVIETEVLPESNFYLLTDIDRGKESLNVRPEDAMKQIREVNRIPLTIDEGVAVVTHYPDFLQKNNCFSLLASRHTGDQRVPAIWINGSKQPNLGWCWDRNPHTWLGSASAKQRLG